VPSTQTLLGYGNLVPLLLNVFEDSIVEGRTNGANVLALAVRPGAIGEQHDGQLALKVDPEGSSRVTEMAG
jgi:hypothetical protein